MNDGASNYDFYCFVQRLRDIITAERWATEDDTFDLIIAAALARLPR